MVDSADVPVAAVLSAMAFDEPSTPAWNDLMSLLPDQGDWQILNNSDDDGYKPNDNGKHYFGIALYDQETQQLYIVNRGSNDTYDWGVSDSSIANQVAPPAFEASLKYYQYIKSTYTEVDGSSVSNYVEAGFSLGGAEAEYVVGGEPQSNSLSGITFGAPGVSWAILGLPNPQSSYDVEAIEYV